MSSSTGTSGSGTFLYQDQDFMLGLCKKYPGLFELRHENIWINQYQLYLVEQWVTNRNKIIQSVINYTGDKKHEVRFTSIKVNNGSTCDEWSRFINFYTQEPEKCKLNELKEGNLYVHNLLLIPSELNLILVPDGNLATGLDAVKLNINLKRLGCAGRSAIGVQTPSSAQKERFMQIYKTSPSLELPVAVTELVKLAQGALFLFGYLLRNDYINGLLCDNTLEAIRNYIKDFGPFNDHGVPHDNGNVDVLCDASFVSSLLSKLAMTKNQLITSGIQCPKNIFIDLNLFQNSISQFQKIYKVPVTYLLDQNTREKLQENIGRASPPSGIKVTKVLKRFDELSGREHSSSFDLETSDLDTFIKSCAHFDFVKQLWGKKKQKISITSDGEDVLLDTAHIAEGIIQGGKELGKNLLKNVTGRAPRIPERNPIKGLRDGVVEGISRISSTITEGFNERKKSREKRNKSMAELEIEQVIQEPGDDYTAFEEEDNIRRYANTLNKKHHSLPQVHSVESHSTQQVARSNSAPVDNEFTLMERKENMNEILAKLKRREIEMVTTIDNLQNLSGEYTEKIQNLSDIYLANWHNFANVETVLNDLIDQHKLVQNRIGSLELRSSKLQYEISVLEDKIRETDETIENFRSKLHSLDKRVNQGIKFSTQFDVIGFIMSKITSYKIAAEQTVNHQKGKET